MRILAPAALAAMLLAAPALAEPGRPAGPPPLAGLSEPGRRAVLQSMAATSVADRADRERVRASRDRMMQLLGQDRLDVPALRRAMDEERDAANAMRARRQAAMLQTFQGLSAADRKAFVADATQMRGRFEKQWPRLKRWRGGPPGMEDGPPPPGL